ncbi:hypothetical protein [Heliorestis convoluta]|uniref:Methyl-accepting chemotaxis protein n=1 Tax=Heliorestis convoluta TaxID=356322 RepID=A0A5Q2N386_9FIRM|nr:hypothetical protein [Heliorestis convoluta]QGG48333.1 hypothetical protein FTV88_2235 [Heliorestis convoluta]
MNWFRELPIVRKVKVGLITIVSIMALTVIVAAMGFFVINQSLRMLTPKKPSSPYATGLSEIVTKT